jgi:tetratricopeptide (TPR) repeat protein
MLRISIFGFLAASASGARELSPRELYNQGAQSLEKGYLREAESYLLQAASSNLASLQPPALYDLGHVRFRQGKELLKGEQPRQPMIDRAENATDDGQDAIREAERALKSENLEQIIGAYLAGRGARKQLRLANEDVQRALDLYGAVLVRWRRSVGDFRSTVELRTNDQDAEFNAKVVQRHIDELLKQLKELAEKKQQLGKTRGDLKKKMEGLKGKIPKEMMRPGQGENEDDEDEEGGEQPKPESGWQDQVGKTGEKRGITPEMAQQILEALRLNGDRKLPVGDEQQAPPKDRKGKDW